MKAGEARLVVFARDDWTCIAPRVDIYAGPCFNKWGEMFSGYDGTGRHLEAERVPEAPGSRSASHEDPTTMLTLCAGHHRGTGPNGGRTWGPSHREEERRWLERKYGSRSQ